ncbi:MAG: sce7726 family protein [Dyella sp.]|uniref:sce7726 family protein n=1 Tax=Dyella sp. TaxID=1869338 RepID=UPI003F81C1BC
MRVRTQLSELLVKCGGPKRIRVSEVYEAAFAHLSRNQPAEYFYKNALLQRNVLSRYGSKRARVFFEFRAGKSKLDALVVRESMHAYEIKTDLDHFRRLPTQIADYQLRFAHVWLLASEKQAARLEAQVPASVGIAFMSPRRTFEVARAASLHTSQLRSESILECLRRSEYLRVVREFGFSDSGVPNTLVFRRAMDFSRRLDPLQVHEATLTALKARSSALSAASLARLPLYMRAAAVASSCGDKQIETLLANLAKRVNQGRGVP